MVNARAKGNSGELEAIDWLHKYIWQRNIGLQRHLAQSRDGGHDIIAHPFVIEVKRRAKSERNLGFNGWWAQANKATTRANAMDQVNTYVPVVMYRIDHAQWEFLISARITGIHRTGWVHVARQTFIAWARRYAGLI